MRTPTSAVEASAASRNGTGAPPPTVLVDCVVRSDAATKSGGDSVQIAEYARHLAEWGVDLREVPFHPAMTLRPTAVVHVFNVDRPFEFLLACRAARGHRLVVSPIHHRIDRVRAMRAADRGRGLTSLSARVLPEPVREWLATAVRAARGARGLEGAIAAAGASVRTLPLVPTVWRAAGRALDAAEAVALLAAGEGRDLRRLTGWRADNEVVVPNGRPEDLDSGDRLAWADRPRGSVIVIGRIEPRKRQLEVARAAVALQIPVVFVGPLANEGSAYSADFAQLAASSPFVEHTGPADRGEVLARLGRTRVLLNASWVEVQSLVDLEAATLGCAVVGTRTGHSREWLGDAVTVVDGDDPAELLRRAAMIAADDRHLVPTTDYDRTWRQAAAQLLDVYRRP